MSSSTSPPSRPARSSGSRSAVGIVVVHYTGREDTLECLASVSRLTYPSVSVYVVDQGVGDGTPEAVREAYPDVRVIENGRNLGFTGGCNVGIRAALADGAEAIFLLNNDATVAPDLIDLLMGFLERAPGVGIAGPTVLYYDRPETVWATGGCIDWRGRSSLRDEGRPAREVEEAVGSATVAADFIVGCGMLIRRAVFDRIGLFDERFFLYYEEADLCGRAHEAGFGVEWLPGARLWHRVSRATGTDSALTVYYMRRNALLYLSKRGNRRGVLAAMWDTVRLALVWKLQGKQKEFRGALIRALGDALRGRWGAMEGTPR